MPAAGTQSQQHVAGVDVIVGGATLDPKWRDLTIEVKVVNSLTVPDMALVRLSDPRAESIDSHPLRLGADLEIKSSSTSERSTSSIFKGQIAAVEPEFTAQGCVISARAYAKTHKLNRERKNRTFQQMSASDIVRKVLPGNSGLTLQAESTNIVYDYFQQSGETDWAFVWRLALMNDFEIATEGDKLFFRKAKHDGGPDATLKWQAELISFRPRVSGVQQPKTVIVNTWDPKTKQKITGRADGARPSSPAGLDRNRVSSDLGGGETKLADLVANTDGEANALAKATLDRTADAFYEADGVAHGNPALKAGSRVKIDGVGSQFGGTFTITTATHRYTGGSGYQTHFQIAGRSSRTLLELIRQPDKRDWSASLVVGVVTNNNDPENMGRVKVKFPSLDDTEGTWARVATPSTGKARGMLMLPQPDEEVIVGFEHGDTRRPVVVGSVFNGRDKPGAELEQNRDGSLGVVSNEKIHLHSKNTFEIKSDENMTVNIKNDGTFEAGASMTVKGVQVTVEASDGLTLKGATVDIQASGPVNVKGAVINLG
jgi:phage protein D/phage baseplate assembly protein gpV